MIDINKAKQTLSDPAPLKIIEWVVEQASKSITTTNFGPHEAVVLHMVTQVKAYIQRYLEKFGLPNVSKHFDPTKALYNRECGLHTALTR